MKYLILLILVLTSTVSFSQEVLGIWDGEMQGLKNHIQISVMMLTNNKIGAVLFLDNIYMLADSSFNGTDLHLKTSENQMFMRIKKEMLKKGSVPLYQEINFNGTLTTNKNQLNGQLILDGKVFDVELSRKDKPILRPQEPQKPYPYYSEDVTVFNKKDKVVLAGTLTIPNKDGKFPAVIIKSGSNPLDRDGKSNDHHKTFLVLADYLTMHGIAVLRYDDRGIGKSTGDFGQSTIVDFADDLQVWREYLASRKEIRGNKIGIIGHSEGGLVASIAAGRGNDIKFVVMLAAPGIRLKKVFEDQIELQYKCGDISNQRFEFEKKINKTTYQLLNSNVGSKAIFDSLINFKDEFIAMPLGMFPKTVETDILSAELFSEMISGRTNPHSLYDLNVLPSEYIEKITCPVLSLNGMNDRLVPAKVNQEAIRQALLKAGNKDFKVVEIEGLNHLFQECQTGSMKEVSTIEQTFSPKALDIITHWILEHVKE